MKFLLKHDVCILFMLYFDFGLYFLEIKVFIFVFVMIHPVFYAGSKCCLS